VRATGVGPIFGADIDFPDNLSRTHLINREGED
jgi:hypothetical protein